ncbi:serine hydrolase [Vagococcus fluvialis]|uniref:serine hydrolase n=1 Tax=Vagococcus fluvialis TaxID=2738 RepID=UPI001D0B1631|nr:serine hydrolase [Vagococcus fluvialis]UDM79000.1 class A beta-lactamase-related serine hydrolase [Vagococcus fluvialis]
MKKVWLMLVISLSVIVFTANLGYGEEISDSSTIIESTETTSADEVESQTDIPEPSEQSLKTETNMSATETVASEEINEDEIIEQEFNKYVSLKEKSISVFKDKNFDAVIEHQFIYGQTFLAREKLITKDQFIYYSLYDKADELVGYVAEFDVKIANNKGGVYQKFGKYVTVTTREGLLLSNFEGKEKGRVDRIYKNTYLAKGKYHNFDGTVYYSIFDNKDIWQGYIREENISLSDNNKQGVYQAYGNYVIVKKNNYSIWQNFNWKKKYNSNLFFNRTFLAKGEYHHFNGEVYYSLYDLDNKWYGYINKSGVQITNGAQGNYVSLGKYVTIKNINSHIWKNFDWQKKHYIKDLTGQTFLARGVYHHANGSDYYSLYDRNNKWYGYINKKFVTVAPGKQGSYQSLGKYVTVTKGNYDVWQNFSWKRKTTTKNLQNNTYQARGKYNHFNGSTYYSLYDNKGKWLGYLNSSGAKIGDGEQGIYQSYWKQVTISKKNYTMWNNFKWVKRDSTNRYINKTYTARGKYNHFNGSTYYSLYDNSGKWYGYLNANGTSQDAEKLAKVQKLLNRKYNMPNYGVYVMSLSDGSVASINGNKQFTAASTGKLPAMYYTQKMINEKKIDPNKKYLYTDAINQMPIYSYMRGGAGILQGKPFGTYYSLDTMLNWTAKYSDNQGANFLGYYGANKYEPKMRNEISRIIGRQWVSPFQVSAKENALLIAEMDRQGGQVMKYMQNTIFDNQRIPKYLPVKVAHKIGDVGSFTHDIAVVYTDRPYVLSVMTQYGSYETISILSKEVYDIMK